MPERNKAHKVFTVARLFFLLVVIPLLLISSLIALSVINLSSLTKKTLDDPKAQQEILARATGQAQSIAGFLQERREDVLIATILPVKAESYQSFLETKTQALWVKNDTGIEKVQLPLYTEMSFIDAKGFERIKIINGRIIAAVKQVNVSIPANTTFKSEDYFHKTKALGKGELYISPLTGWYINKTDYEKGSRFKGIIRIATPLFDKQGFMGMVVLSLDARHLMKFTDNIIPTQSTQVIKADAATGNFAFMVDSSGNVIAHPDEYHIAGLYQDGTQVPALTLTNSADMKRKGEEVLNFKKDDGMDQIMLEVEREAAAGKSGIKKFQMEGQHSKFVAYAPIPFYTQDLPKPAGFGWVGMEVDLDKFNEGAQLANAKIEKQSQAWLTTVVVIIFLAMIILFAIAAILARGINRSIMQELPPDAMQSKIEDDRD